MSKLSNILVPLCLIGVIGSVGAAVYFKKQLNDIKANPQKVAEDEVKAVVEQVGKIMILPDSETPTLATVADPAKLREQAFFAKAKVGDKLLLYTNARKAILYDPVENKIVEVAPINIGNNQLAPAPAPTPAPAQ